MIIGITGVAGSGKDTVADYICRKYGYGKTSYASKLKQMLAVAGLPEPSNRDDKEKVVEGFNFTWREAAQKLGTEWARNLDKDFWVKSTMRQIDKDALVVISDVRFDNEAQAIIDAGGLVIKVVGRNVNLGNNSVHASEQGVNGYLIHYELENDGSLECLYSYIDDIFDEEGLYK